ncbi:hypothetical protein LR48_Vigan11g146000 [Vigna angularis]|uniref:ADP-ribosyl cyclase/cyclic ADP-ribose hydrolase n=1 Tax=Phaseolus angularis TaxID=3914 RepID=A0A0L9VTL8_PHAAN|nr:hypothetical protein LR48_Vigan11g146000 [Vigna angularis]
MEFASFSSSSSSSSFLKSEPQFIYDVFINFGGEDIGRKFVSHLHSALLLAQVKTFISKENLQEGIKLEEHMRAIASSKIAIIVFSKKYTESTCSRLELEKIIECRQTFGQIVLPVIYDIARLDEHLQKVVRVLEKAAPGSYSGEQLDHAMSRHDAEFVKEIVRRIQTLLDYTDMSITQFSVGLESHVEKGTKAIQGLSLKLHSTGRDYFEAYAFKEMKRLRFLQLDHVQLTDEAIEMMNKQRVELEELKKEVLEKEEKASSVLEPDGEEDEDVEKNPMKMLAKIVEKSPKVKNELVKVIEKSSITKSVKALKRSTKVKDKRTERKKKKSNLIERSKPGIYLFILSSVAAK